MRRWLILIAASLACLPAMADNAAPPLASQPIPVAQPVPFAQSAALQTNAPAATPVPVLTEIPKPAPAADVPLDMPVHPAGKIRYDGSIQDSLGFVSIRPLPDVSEDLPPYLQRVNHLRAHGDNILAISYLRQIVSNGQIIPQYRARAMLQLADCLCSEHREAEGLCWLKIWMELYPQRPEIGAVAYRIGALYSKMGLPDPARDAFYLALAHTINEGHVETADDLKRYTELTVGTLWGLAANEYQSGQWQRAAELFARYRKECPTAPPLSLEKAAYLQADCYYQLKQMDPAATLYEQTLAAHPFNPLAPEARLRLYHLDILAKKPSAAREQLEALVWTVRTVWPKDEIYWQKETAQLLFDLNKKDIDILPPLVQESAQLPPEGKTWQEALNHYDSLVTDEVQTADVNMDLPVNLTGKTGGRQGLPEQTDLQQMSRSLNQLLPPPRTADNE